MLLEKGLYVGGATGAEWECPRRICPLFVLHCCCGERAFSFTFTFRFTFNLGLSFTFLSNDYFLPLAGTIIHRYCITLIIKYKIGS